MENHVVAVKRYEASPGSLKELMELCGGLDRLKPDHNVFIKPNLVAMDRYYPMPLYGVYTTTRLVHDMVVLLKGHGVKKITIGEGSVQVKKFGLKTGQIYHALGYPVLKERYGVEFIDINEGPFEDVDFGEFELQIFRPALESDFFINMPVMKTHNQSIVSFGLKNLKGCLSIKSRKFCHSSDHNLNHYLSLFVERLNPALTVLDGIYGLEKGPFYTGKAVRMDTLIASRDPLAVDVTGAIMTGFNPPDIPHIREYAERHGRSVSPDQFDIRGTPVKELKRPLKWDNKWSDDNTGPKAWGRMGINGISFPKYDNTLCTGCSGLYSPILIMIMSAYKGEPFNDIEILTGKAMRPSGKAKKTILIGNCMIKANRKDPNIKEALLTKGCPPSLESIREAMDECGIHADMDYYKKYRDSLMDRYRGKEGFDEGFFYLK